MPEKAEAQPPRAQLIQMATAHWVSRFVYAAAEMNLADQLSEGPRTAEELAQSNATHAPSLYRLMRTLASLGLFSEDSSHRFSLTPLGAGLKTGTTGRATVLTLAGEWNTRSLEQLPYAARTGNSAFEKVFGLSLFDYLAQHPLDASLFSQTMVGLHGPEAPAVAAAYDFSKLGTIVDVGGATGNMLSAILNHHPEPRGILFDLAHVVGDAPALIQARGVEDRITIEAGSFFDGVPVGGDAYLLSHIIHDWSEDSC